ncbi:unnamed protein product [Rhizoctonia solani]|uniref:Uncharacterized protein n=1 Tax=Rhizoctonia solani TaxID=456999 RepID=A0A8H2X9G3_9AGAM|nr:unnamed protein product [Rhizoctonia solani]
MPEEAQAKGSDSPCAQTTSTPEEEVPSPVLPASEPSAAGPSHVHSAITGPSSAGSLVLATHHSTATVAHQPTIELTPCQGPNTQRASDEISRPTKRPCIDPSSGSGKGKQKAVALDQPTIDAPTPPQDAPPPAQNASGPPPPQDVTPPPLQDVPPPLSSDVPPPLSLLLSWVL